VPQHPVPWRLVSAEGRTLHLAAQAGGPPCEAISSVDVDERATVVKVAVNAGSLPGAKCGPGVRAIIGTFPVTVHLKAPLGSRALVER
jgi:hypothetical protein